MMLSINDDTIAQKNDFHVRPWCKTLPKQCQLVLMSTNEWVVEWEEEREEEWEEGFIAAR
jgi:hypothetical protein